MSCDDRLVQPTVWLHVAHLARRGDAVVEGARRRLLLPRPRRSVAHHPKRRVGRVVSPPVVVHTVEGDAGEEQGEGERHAADAEQHDPDQLADVELEVEVDGVPVHDRHPVGQLAHHGRLVRHQVADQHADDAEHQQVDADPDEHLPPDGAATAPPPPRRRRRVEQVARIVIVLVDHRVLVDVRVVEVVQVGAHAEVVGADGVRPALGGVFSLQILVHLLQGRVPLQSLPLRSDALLRRAVGGRVARPAARRLVARLHGRLDTTL